MKAVAPAGARDRLITLEQMVTATDARFNASKVTWTPLVSVWAKKLESSAETSNGSPAEQGTVLAARPTKYWIRWRELDKASVRINDSGTILRIVGTAEVGRRVRLEIACKEWAHEQ